MISKNRIKFIRSLELKKKRRETKLFVAEGPKVINELIGVLPCTYLAATNEWFGNNPHWESILKQKNIETDIVTQEELTRTSFLKTPQEALAIFSQPESLFNSEELIENSLCLALDDVQDPGNLGTIIRLADWFGIEHIFCSQGSADAYNPKSVQATMGAIARVQVHYGSLLSLLESLPKETPVYGTFLEGDNLYTLPLQQRGIIIMGNEGNGISPQIEKLVNQRLNIPYYPQSRETSESLNVAIATAIVCAEFRRRT